MKHPKEKFLPAVHCKAWTLGDCHASKVYNRKNSHCESRHFCQMNTTWLVF